MKIGGMGGLEIVIILVVILIIFGPKNLPKLGKAVGKTLSNLRSGMNEGKKKEVDEPAETADGEAGEEDAPAQIAGETEDVEFAADEPDGEPDGDAPDENAGKEPGAANEPDEVIEAAESAVSEAEAAADEAFQAKRVKRVVRKKVVTEEPAE